MEPENHLHSLIPLEDFKAILSIDDREDTLARYCLVTTTYTIEQYCKRRLLRKKYYETLSFYGDYIFPSGNIRCGRFRGSINPTVRKG
jgi:hypothetical protein